MILFNKIKMLALLLLLASFHASAAEVAANSQKPSAIGKKARRELEEVLVGQGHRGTVRNGSPFKGTPKPSPNTVKKRKNSEGDNDFQSKRRKIAIEAARQLDFEDLNASVNIDAVVKISDEDLSREARNTVDVRNTLKKANKDYHRIPEIADFPQGKEIKELKMQKVFGARMDEAIRQSFFTQREFLELVRNIFLWFADIHDEGYCHEDISFGNIMVLPHDTTYFSIIDWELAGKENIDTRTICGHQDFTAPEVKKTGTFIRREADIYSLGKLMDNFFGETIYKDVRKLIKRMTHEKPESRITLPQAIERLNSILENFSDEIFIYGSFETKEMVQGLDSNAITSGYVGDPQ